MDKLIWLLAVPFVGSVISFIGLPLLSPLTRKWSALFMSLIPLAILLSQSPTEWLSSEIDTAWFPSLSIRFHLKIDSLSLLFLYLTAVIVPISLLAINDENFSFSSLLYGFVLLLQGLLIGFFTARDLVLFTIFWEAMLFPLYFMITLWGGPQRQAAALKFLIYMIAGSALMIGAVLSLYFFSRPMDMSTFNLDQLARFPLNAPYATWLFAIFALAFAVKTPLFPFHAWLPDAYYQASTTGTILLSALLSKAGIYGFLRIGFELFPNVMKEWRMGLLGLAIIGVLYGGLAAWRQNDFKRLIAYSSFSHVNFILAGIFAWDLIAEEGAILQAINHGVTITGLFLVAGWLQERLGSTQIPPFSGMAKFLPSLCWLTFIFVLSSVALPGTNNFIGELLILFGLFGKHPWLTAILGLTVILSVMYMLRWMQYLYFQSPNTSHNQWTDIKARELFIAFPLVALIFWVGFYPAPILKQVVPAAEKNIAMAQSEET